MKKTLVLGLLFFLMLMCGCLNEAHTPRQQSAFPSHKNELMPEIIGQIASADHVVATNWAEAGMGAQGFCFQISSEKTRRLIKAITEAKRSSNQEHPDWEYNWELQFYAATNLLGVLHFKAGDFLASGVFRDETGALDGIYQELIKLENYERFYKDENKHFLEAEKAEARQWLKSAQHSVAPEDKGKVTRFVNNFYRVGADKVFLGNIKKGFDVNGAVIENATMMIVVLPQDAQVRKKIFSLVWQEPGAWITEPDSDVGQKYLWYPFE